MVLREGARPAPFGFSDSFVEGFAFEDEGGELDGPVGRGGKAAP